MMKLGRMEDYLARENVTAFYSNCRRLVGFDYNKTASFSRDWDYLTMTARGLVFEVSTGKLISRAYDKFYNLHEPEVGGIENLPDAEFEALEKADGSMISSFLYDGEIWYMTRGSFNSDQAIWAKKWAEKNICGEVYADKPYTFIYECIYPANRIVVDYGPLEELRLTGIRDLITGDLLSYDLMTKCAGELGCSIIRKFPYKTITEVIDAVKSFTMNEEGIVVRYANGFMTKIKGEEYCKVHRLLSCISPLAFWRAIDLDTLKIPSNFLEGIPEEFRKDTDELTALMESRHLDMLHMIKSYADSIPEFENTNEGKRERYEYISKMCGKFTSMVINYANGKTKTVNDWIHREVRPTGNQLDGVSENLQRFLLENDE